MMDRVTKGFFGRMKKIQAMRMLGSGMDIGEIQEYAHEICLLLILKIFRREITDNPDRTRADLVFLSQEAMNDLGLNPDRATAERIADGVLWYRDPTRQEPFSTKIFNEDTGIHEEFKFKYLKYDREHSQWESGGPTVYMLTEEAQEVIFITREILEEFGFDIEQFYTLQLIKSGNFNKAEGSVDNLIARVRTLIGREKEYREAIIRNPQVIFFGSRKNKQKSEEEIKRQFEEEQKVFRDMFSWKNRVDAFPEEQKTEAINMFDNLERARMLHNELAKMVVENMALEVEMRVQYPERFWKISSLSFKKDIWQNIIEKNGLSSFELLEDIITPLFSPEIPFVFPLDWSWETQRTIGWKSIEGGEDIDDIEPEETWQEKGVDWEVITELFDEVFSSLLEYGIFKISNLKDISDQDKLKWLYQKENIDMLMMLIITELQLTTNYDLNGKVDERLELFVRLCNKKEKFRKLEGSILSSYIEEGEKDLEWEEIKISPYVICIKKQ